LAELIPKCWVYDPDKRIDIFELVEQLRAAVQAIRKQTMVDYRDHNLENKE